MPKDGNAAAGISPLAGKPATKDMLIDVGKRERDYFARRRDISGPNQLVSFGTSGHRGPPFSATFTKPTFWPLPRPSVITAARKPSTALSMGKDTHAKQAGRA